MHIELLIGHWRVPAKAAGACARDPTVGTTPCQVQPRDGRTEWRGYQWFIDAGLADPVYRHALCNLPLSTAS